MVSLFARPCCDVTVQNRGNPGDFRSHIHSGSSALLRQFNTCPFSLCELWKSRDVELIRRHGPVTSLNIHSHCSGALGQDESPSGCFWDTGIAAVSFRGGDHWSNDAEFEGNTWKDAQALSVEPSMSTLMQLQERS